jgi:hypothetical protein
MRERVFWLVRGFGVLSGIVSYHFWGAFSDVFVFGVWLATEWELSRRAVKAQVKKLVVQFAGLEKRADEALHFAYLEEPKDIWNRARRILEEAQSRDEVWSTASWPNDPAFEEAVFRRAVATGFFYKRLLCYTDDGLSDDHGRTFPAFVDSANMPNVLDRYCDWYREFFKKWAETVAQDPSGSLSNQAMKTWYDALFKLQLRISNVFRVRSLGSEVASDYFILFPSSDFNRMKAVVGFPMTEDGMRGGLAITLPKLAWDLRLNLMRLWSPKPNRSGQNRAEAAAQSRSKPEGGIQHGGP